MKSVEIRYVRQSDKEFWFTLDKHIAFAEFDKKVRDRQGYVLLVDGRPAGILRYNLFWDNTPFCNLLYIDSRYRRQGLGAILMTRWENEASALGYGRLLTSTQSDEEGRYFYQKIGYAECGSMTVPNESVELFLAKTVPATSYEKLGEANFNAASLDGFQRRQEVFRCWRKTDDGYKLAPVHYVEDWDLTERRQLAQRILKTVSDGGLAYGAIKNGEVIGFALLDGALFGSKNQYIDLAEFYVSTPYRGMGVGKRLFAAACDGARELGAAKLYISAHSAEDSISAYKSYGCTFAEEINARLAEKEPCDLQLEYNIAK